MRSRAAAFALALVLGLVVLSNRGAAAAAPADGRGQWEHCLVVDCATDTRLYWNISGGTVLASMQSRSAGYVAVGLTGGGSNPMVSSGETPGSDVIVGWAGSEEAPATAGVRDYDIRQYGIPPLDPQQDVTLLGAWSWTEDLGSGKTVPRLRVDWRRALDTGDTAHDRVINVTAGETQNLIWALNPSEGAMQAADGSRFLKHEAVTRGVVPISWADSPARCEACPDSQPSAYADLVRSCVSNGWSSSASAGSTQGAAETGPTGFSGACFQSGQSREISIGWAGNDDGTTMDFTVKAKIPSPGWVGVGFSSDQNMPQSDMYVMWVDSAAGSTVSNLTVVDAWATARSAPQPDSDGTSDAVPISGVYDEASGVTTVSFRRPIAAPAGQAAAEDVSLDKPVYLLWAYGSGTPTLLGDGSQLSMRAHSATARGFSSAKIDFSTCSGEGASVPIGLQTGYLVHGSLMVLAFWAMMIGGASAPLCRRSVNGAAAPCVPWKGKEPWFYVHMGLQLLAIVVAAASLAVVAATVGGFRIRSTHSILGVASCTLAVLQIVLGLCRPDKGAGTTRAVWRFAHRLVALATVVASSGAIVLGALSAGVQPGVVYGVLGAHFAVAILVVVLNRRCSSGSPAKALGRSPTSPEEREGIVAEAPGEFALATRRPEGAGGDDVVKDWPGDAPEAAGRRSRGCRPTCAAPLSGAALLLTSLGMVAAVIVGSRTRGAALPPYTGGEQNLCLHMEEYQVPAQETTYVCRGFALPQDVPLHAIRFLPLIDKAAVLHHLIVYTSTTDMRSRGDFLCPTMPPGSQPLYVWAVGGLEFQPPPDAGFPLGKESSTSPGHKWAVLQIHYNNVGSKPGIVDSSGAFMTLTDTLRPLDAGYMLLGVDIHKLNIPANKAMYGVAGTCPSSRTRALPEPSSLNPLATKFRIEATLLHMHLIGKSIWVEQRRGNGLVTVNGTDPVGSDFFYDYAQQRFTPVPSGTTLERGDQFSVRCVFTNTIEQGLKTGNEAAAAGQAVQGCEATACEMCIAYTLIVPSLGSSGVCLDRNPTNFCDNDPSSGKPSCDAVISAKTATQDS